MSQSKGHLLVVDNDPEVRALTRNALTGCGFTCDVAADGHEAFRLSSKTSYTGIITDLCLPALCDQAPPNDLKKPADPPPMMVVTALGGDRLVRDLLDRGIHEVLQKPVDYGVLASRVAAMVGRDPDVSSLVAGEESSDGVSRRSELLQRIESRLVELTELCGDRLDRAFEYKDELPDPPRSAREFIRLLEETQAGGWAQAAIVQPSHEARQSERVACFATAIGVPVNRDWNPIGEPFKLALRDLSEGGVRLLHTRATNAQYLALRWSATYLIAKQIRVVCQIRLCKPLGLFYDLGCQFVEADSAAN